jgi:hypothetical protein
MRGIVGIIAPHAAELRDTDLATFVCALAHGGPDGEGRRRSPNTKWAVVFAVIDPHLMAAAERLVLPGVGALDKAMHALQERRLAAEHETDRMERLIDAPAVPNTDYPNQAALRAVLNFTKHLARKMRLRRADPLTA